MIKKLAGIKVIFLIEMIISSFIFSGCYNSLSDSPEPKHDGKRNNGNENKNNRQFFA